MFTTITMIDFRKPLAQRKRKHTGPYFFSPNKIGAKPAKPLGFYMASSGFQMDQAGSTLDLRIAEANDHLQDYGYGSLKRTNGYYCGDYCDETMTPIIAWLPNKRGFLAGWTMGKGMCASLSLTIHDTIEEAARAAHGEAEHAAEKEREFHREQEQLRIEEEEAEELAEQLATLTADERPDLAPQYEVRTS